MTETHKSFAENVVKIFKDNPDNLGIAVGGSWITDEIDEFSDIDFIVVTKYKIAPDTKKMKEFASQFGELLNGFRGDHVGEQRLLICLYDNPILHVDFKFLIPEEFYKRIENPTILWERGNTLSNIIQKSEYNFPFPDYQWLEDRFWVWIHYTATKIGRGEFFEIFDNLNFLRTNVIIPLLQIKNGNLPRGFRKVEKNISEEDLEKLQSTIARYDRDSLIAALLKIIQLYQELRNKIFTTEIKFQKRTELRSLEYLKEILKK